MPSTLVSRPLHGACKTLEELLRYFSRGREFVLFAALFIILSSGHLAAGEMNVSSAIELLKKPSWRARNLGLRQVTALKETENPEVAIILITNLKRELQRTNSYTKAEDTSYQEYYGNLVTAVQKIASDSGRQDAFNAVVRSAFNPDSGLERWISSQPGAKISVLRAERSSDPAIRQNALYILARQLQLARCNESHRFRSTPAERSGWLDLISHEARNPLSAVRGMAILALGITGEQSQKAYLEITSQNSKEPSDVQHLARSALADFINAQCSDAHH